MEKIRKIRTIGAMLLTALWLAIAICAWVGEEHDISKTERRKLQKFPELTVESVLDGDFTSEFESYTLDQFPARDTFRTIKSLFHYYVLGQSDNNDIYIHDGYAAKMEYPLNQSSVQNAVDKFNNIYDAYLKDTDISAYMSVIPDKGYYIAEESGHLKMNYENMFSAIKDVKWAEYIDITDALSIESYYKTDTHWRQEKILPVAMRLCEAMEADIPKDEDFVESKVESPFYGVYYGQATLPMSSENIYVMENETTKNSTVFDYETNKEVSVYNDDAVNSNDFYDTYLHGAKALLRIENPDAKTDKELIVFRDSFGSSIAPLMIDGYKTITLVDIRYMTSKLLGEYIEFDNQDVLFLYSTLILNNSFTFK